MQSLEADKRDPAPSRTSYKMQRLWLTPIYRSVLRAGMPAAIILGAGYWYISDDTRASNLKLGLSEVRANIEQRPEFMVNLMRIEDVSAKVAEDIREITALDFPVSSFDLDLTELRTRIQELDAVAEIALVIRSGGVLDVEVVERVPVIVWRSRNALELLDADGHRVAALKGRKDRTDLPLIAGVGADQAVPEAIRLIAATRPIAKRVRGLLRVGSRRWDMVLDRDQRIMLPEEDPVSALERVLALDVSADLMARDLIIIDMRDTRRPILRLSGETVEILSQIENETDGDDT